MANLTIFLSVIILILIALCVWLWIKYRSESKAKWNEISYQAGLNAKIADLKSSNEVLNAYCKQFFEENVDLQIDNNWLQDNLSAILCPHNDHVWVDGKCKKCGRKHIVKNS